MENQINDLVKQLAFYDFTTQTLFEVLRLNSDWASAKQVDEVLDFINHLRQKRAELIDAYK